jgi:exodeoxyribonuclease X
MTLIRVIDLECTGLEPTDEVVEIGAVDVAFNTHTKELARLAVHGQRLVRPRKPIPPEASAIHHLTDNDVKDAGLWDDIWPLFLTPEVGIYAAHHAAFEGQWLTETMRQGAPFICTYKAALRVWPDAPNHKNQTLRYWRNIQLERELCEPVHRALPDAYVTANVLVDLVAAGAAFEDMIAWTKEPALLPTCPIGDYRGKKWPEVEYGFLSWIINKPVDDPDIVWNAKRELARRARVQENARAEKQEVVGDSDVAVRRAAYVQLCKAAIFQAQSVADLNDWFREQRAMNFPKYGIDQDAEEYRTIVSECAARKAQLQQQEQPHAAAA